MRKVRNVSITIDELIDFEKEVKDLFLKKEIPFPVHLSGGNEKQLIKIFKYINYRDWVLSTWRSHYHAILHGIPKHWVLKEIKKGNSIALQSLQKNFLTSAIVGGICPIAVGIGLALKRTNKEKKVWCFIGDMAGEMGIFQESFKYVVRNDLPVVFVLEDNGFAVNTITQESWGEKSNLTERNMNKHFMTYNYKRIYPHVGAGSQVTF